MEALQCISRPGHHHCVLTFEPRDDASNRKASHAAANATRRQAVLVFRTIFTVEGEAFAPLYVGSSTDGSAGYDGVICCCTDELTSPGLCGAGSAGSAWRWRARTKKMIATIRTRAPRMPPTMAPTGASSLPPPDETGLRGEGEGEGGGVGGGATTSGTETPVKVCSAGGATSTVTPSAEEMLAGCCAKKVVAVPCTDVTS